jgi:asparagine synthase (glutamine-hydrolysing)
VTALAGLIDFSRTSFNELPCRDMLAAQQNFGAGKPLVVSRDGVAFGIDLRQMLDEDQFDAQPLLIDGTLLIADIRLDNRQDLLDAIGRDRSAGLSDSGVLALAWERWGEACVSQIIGDFALAAFSFDTGKLLLARDLTGQRPLHYARLGSRIAFASLPSGILALEDFRRGFNPQSLGRALLDIPYQPGSSCFAGIHRVPAGGAMTISPDGERSIPVWEPTFEETRLQRPGEYVEAYREVLDKAVSSRLRGVGKIVTSQLSSGFDSSAIASTAARQIGPGGTLIAFTAAPSAGFEAPPRRGRIADESALAATTAAMHGMRHVVVRRSGPLVDRLRDQARFFQDPYRNLINAPWLKAIEDAARDCGGRVLLAGDLGNLTLNAGNLRTLADIRRRRGLLAWGREAWKVAQRGDVRWTGILYNSLGDSLPRGIQQRLIRMFFGVRPKESLSLINPDLALQVVPEADLDYGIRTDDSYRERWEYLRTLDYGNIRQGSFAESGIETRDPMSDRRIIEFSTGLPAEQLLHNGVSRPLAKAALADRVPAAVLHSQVRGYQSSDWILQLDREAMRELVEEIAASTTVRELLDIPKMLRLFDDWPRMRADSFADYELFAGHLPQAIAVGLFVREFER